VSVDLSELIKQLNEEVETACDPQEESYRAEVESLSALRESVEQFFAGQEDTYEKMSDVVSQSTQAQAEDRARMLAEVRAQNSPDVSGQVMQGLELLSRRVDSLAAQFGTSGSSPQAAEPADPALDSVMSQFDLLQQDLARRNGEVP